MSTFNKAVRSFIADEDGVTALEYGMIAALIAVGIMASVNTLGDNLASTFGKISTELLKS